MRELHIVCVYTIHMYIYIYICNIFEPMQSLEHLSWEGPKVTRPTKPKARFCLRVLKGIHPSICLSILTSIIYHLSIYLYKGLWALQSEPTIQEVVWRLSMGPKRPHKHQDPAKHGCCNHPCLGALRTRR